jgi:DNA-binding beta-propeller fold protein YncE
MRLEAVLAAALIGLLAGAPAAARELAFVQAIVDGAPGVDGLADAVDAVVSPDGAFVYVAGKADDAVAIFARDAQTGALSWVGRVLWEGQPGGDVPSFDRPEVLALSPGGAQLYVGCGNSSSVVVFARDPVTGGLGFVQAVLDAAPSDLLARPFGLALSPDGEQLYVASFGDSSVSVFSRDPVTGSLAFVEAETAGVNDPAGLWGARSIALSPDGAHLYVTGTLDDSLAVFARDPGSGALAFVEVKQDGVDADGLQNPREVVVSPDGTNVYVAGGAENAVAVFARDPGSGTLGFVGAAREGVGGVGGLVQPNGLAVGSDGARLYVAAQGAVGSGSGALVVFARDAADGALAFLETESEGQQGVSGLAGAFGLEASPDGLHLVVAAEQDDAVAVFRVPEPRAEAGAATALAVLALLAQGAESQSRGRRNTS